MGDAADDLADSIEFNESMRLDHLAGLCAGVCGGCVWCMEGDDDTGIDLRGEG